VISKLTDALQSNDPEIRARAIEVIGLIGKAANDTKTIGLLRDALDDRHGNVSEQAAKSILLITTDWDDYPNISSTRSKSLRILIKALNSKDRKTSIWAARAIRECDEHEKVNNWRDLQLMLPMNELSSIPENGKNLIIVGARLDTDKKEITSLYFRIFDSHGKRVVDTDEEFVTGKRNTLLVLKGVLNTMWPPHELTEDDEGLVIEGVEAIVGCTEKKRRVEGALLGSFGLAQRQEVEESLLKALRSANIEDKPVFAFTLSKNGEYRGKLMPDVSKFLLKNNAETRMYVEKIESRCNLRR